jgi:L-galactose dehydrogenase
MFERALQDDGWEVIMVGFNILNQSARERVFPVTQRKGIGVLDMFAVRRALSRPEALRELMADLEGKNALGFPVDPVAPLDFLLTEGPAASIPDACYRFCRDEPGINVVLVGTGNPEHLEENARSLRAPALSAGAVEKVKKLFAGIDFLSGN